MRDATVCFCNALDAIPEFAALGYEIVIGIDEEKPSHLLFKLQIGHAFSSYALAETDLSLKARSMHLANSGVSCRLCASETGLRAACKTSQGMPCLPRKSRSSGVERSQHERPSTAGDGLRGGAAVTRRRSGNESSKRRGNRRQACRCGDLPHVTP